MALTVIQKVLHQWSLETFVGKFSISELIISKPWACSGSNSKPFLGEFNHTKRFDRKKLILDARICFYSRQPEFKFCWMKMRTIIVTRERSGPKRIIQARQLQLELSRFGEISPLWQNFKHVRKSFQGSFSNWQNFELEIFCNGHCLKWLNIELII